MRLRNIVLTLLAASWLPIAHAKPGPHEPFEVIGNVIKNHDGDTLKLLTADHGIIVVRLSGADTPETGQAYWKAARDNLHEMVAGKPVTIWCYKRDRNDREVCHASVDGNRCRTQSRPARLCLVRLHVRS